MIRSNIHDRKMTFCSLDGCWSLIVEATAKKLLPQIFSVNLKQDNRCQSVLAAREIGINLAERGGTEPRAIRTLGSDLSVMLGEGGEV